MLGFQVWVLAFGFGNGGRFGGAELTCTVVFVGKILVAPLDCSFRCRYCSRNDVAVSFVKRIRPSVWSPVPRRRASPSV